MGENTRRDRVFSRTVAAGISDLRRKGGDFGDSVAEVFRAVGRVLDEEISTVADRSDRTATRTAELFRTPIERLHERIRAIEASLSSHGVVLKIQTLQDRYIHALELLRSTMNRQSELELRMNDVCGKVTKLTNELREVQTELDKAVALASNLGRVVASLGEENGRLNDRVREMDGAVRKADETARKVTGKAAELEAHVEAFIALIRDKAELVVVTDPRLEPAIKTLRAEIDRRLSQMMRVLTRTVQQQLQAGIVLPEGNTPIVQEPIPETRDVKTTPPSASDTHNTVHPAVSADGQVSVPESISRPGSTETFPNNGESAPTDSSGEESGRPTSCVRSQTPVPVSSDGGQVALPLQVAVSAEDESAVSAPVVPDAPTTVSGPTLTDGFSLVILNDHTSPIRYDGSRIIQLRSDLELVVKSFDFDSGMGFVTIRYLDVPKNGDSTWRYLNNAVAFGGRTPTQITIEGSGTIRVVTLSVLVSAGDRKTISLKVKIEGDVVTEPLGKTVFSETDRETIAQLAAALDGYFSPELVARIAVRATRDGKPYIRDLDLAMLRTEIEIGGDPNETAATIISKVEKFGEIAITHGDLTGDLLYAEIAKLRSMRSSSTFVAACRKAVDEFATRIYDSSRLFDDEDKTAAGNL